MTSTPVRGATLRRLVVDASAALAIVLDPGGQGEAIGALVSDRELHAPVLLPYEIANVLRRECLRGRLTTPQATVYEETLARLPIELWPHEVTRDRVRDLNEVLSAYDASYVALAERLNADLVTLDRRIARAPGVRCRVILPT